MIVPAHWSEARVRERVEGRQLTVRRFGWSDESEAEASAMAEERARAAFDRIISGERLAPREPKVPYNGAEGVPIREEIIDRQGEAIVTRNSYGALCLNTPDVLFADVDFAEEPRLLLTCGATLALAALFGWLGSLALGGSWWWLGTLLGILGGPALVRAVWNAWLRCAGGVEAVARKRVAVFVERNQSWLVDVYRTPKGLRLLALHDTFDPAGDQAQGLFSAIDADPIYVKMCARQQCFRARVSPKPWRIGIDAHMKPRSGVWPVDPARLPQRRRWVETYERAAERYASCRFIETLGRGTADPRTARVRALHDRLARVREDLPIA